MKINVLLKVNPTCVGGFGKGFRVAPELCEEIRSKLFFSLRSFWGIKISDDDQKIYSRKLKFLFLGNFLVIRGNFQ
jgi:hypothetical protein